MKLAQLMAQATAQYHFWRAMPLRFDRWLLSLCSPPVPHLHHCFICLIATIVSGTSSSLVLLLLVSCQHHIACHIVLLSHHHCHCHPLMCFIAIAPCTLSPSPHMPHCHCPAPCLAVTITLHPLLPLPCAPHCQCPAPLIPSPHITFGPCAPKMMEGGSSVSDGATGTRA
jgi:hypothetical protein